MYRSIKTEPNRQGIIYMIITITLNVEILNHSFCEIVLNTSFTIISLFSVFVAYDGWCEATI